MSERIKWAVVGSGGIARRRTIPEGIAKARNAELSGVFDVNQKVNREVAKEYGVEPAASVDELLGGDNDAIYVATPAGVHAEQVRACADAGKHVLCEKPLGMSVAEAEEMIALCRRKGVKLGCAFMMRFVAQHREALALIEQGKLGRPVYARAQLSCWYPPIEGAWRQDPATGGGGALIDMGGHCIDLLEMFFGNVAKVSCFVNNTVHGYKSEDSATAMLLFENGALGTVDTFFCIPDSSSKNVLELYGSKGSILAKGTIGQGPAGQMEAFLEEDGKGYNAQQARGAGQSMKIDPEPVNTYQAEIEEFSQAIIENREPAISAELGLRSQKVLTACYESARLGRVVTLG
ncbi:MAG TPA: Gfo/Idh/MocA family oxidoreductase [Sedimentisphaerales bacterium]|nr:Gfo/Idh/MocA family oxidoreductase [Sedimentisphaerales bacterium]